MRGFTPARYLDGLANGSGSGITRIEPCGLERLEVLKGPSSMVYGLLAEGTLLPNLNGKIPPNCFTGEPGKNDYDKTIMSAGYQFRHDFASGVTFTQNLRYGKVGIEPGAGIGAFGLMAFAARFAKRNIRNIPDPIHQNFPPTL